MTPDELDLSIHHTIFGDIKIGPITLFPQQFLRMREKRRHSGQRNGQPYGKLRTKKPVWTEIQIGITALATAVATPMPPSYFIANGVSWGGWVKHSAILIKRKILIKLDDGRYALTDVYKRLLTTLAAEGRVDHRAAIILNSILFYGPSKKDKTDKGMKMTDRIIVNRFINRVMSNTRKGPTQKSVGWLSLAIEWHMSESTLHKTINRINKHSKIIRIYSDNGFRIELKEPEFRARFPGWYLDGTNRAPLSGTSGLPGVLVPDSGGPRSGQWGVLAPDSRVQELQTVQELRGSGTPKEVMPAASSVFDGLAETIFKHLEALAKKNGSSTGKLSIPFIISDLEFIVKEDEIEVVKSYITRSSTRMWKHLKPKLQEHLILHRKKLQKQEVLVAREIEVANQEVRSLRDQGFYTREALLSPIRGVGSFIRLVHLVMTGRVGIRALKDDQTVFGAFQALPLNQQNEIRVCFNLPVKS